MKACPQCGNVNDSAATVCGHCRYNFDTGERGTAVPRILADDSKVIRRGPNTGIVKVIALAVVLGALGLVVYGAVGASDEASSGIDALEDLQIEVPPLEVVPTIEIDNGRIFNEKTCTRAVGNVLERALRAQARGEALNDILTSDLPFLIGSFEFRNMVQILSSIAVQQKLVEGDTKQAIRIARDEAAGNCRRHYQ